MFPFFFPIDYCVPAVIHSFRMIRWGFPSYKAPAKDTRTVYVGDRGSTSYLESPLSFRYGHALSTIVVSFLILTYLAH